MGKEFTLSVNDQIHRLKVEGDTPLIYILRNDLGLKGVKHGCGSEQCGACKVLIDGQAVPTCKLPVEKVQGLAITTIEGLGRIGNLHRRTGTPVRVLYAGHDRLCSRPAESAALSYRRRDPDRKSTRLNSSHSQQSRMPSSA